MNLPPNYEQTLIQRSSNQKTKNLHTYEHEITREVCEYVGEPRKFAMAFGIVKRVGPGQMMALVKQMRERGIKSPEYLMACTKRKPS
jgi:hypothetical protein